MSALWRDRASAVWILLIVATLTSWLLGTDHTIADPRIGSSVVMTLAFVKVRLVGLYFMEIRFAPRPLRLMFDAWIALTCSVVVGLYLSGA